MNFLRFSATLGLAALCGSAVRAEENLWPIRVAQTDAAGEVVSYEAAGPLIFRKPEEAGGESHGFRPLFVQWHDAAGNVTQTHVLYPLFAYRTDGEAYRWNILLLFYRAGNHAGKEQLPTATNERFDIWPFWFSRKTADPAENYHALFPIGGTIMDRLGVDRTTFVLFPLYIRSEKRGAITTSTPWPIVRVTRGTEHGFAVWPLFGQFERPGVWRREFYLWPLAWNNTTYPADDAPAGTSPRREVGVIPFYTRESAPGFINENYLWPFFGYTDRTQPVRYHETRYLWPFLVHGEGDGRNVQRFAPFYTHSLRKGVDKTWVLWPVYREKQLTESGLIQTQRQVLYFLYNSNEQRSATNPHAAPAMRSHFWPLYSYWNNGAGKRQLQFPSPMGVFFPYNEGMRASWAPLFALYRYDQRAAGEASHNILWGLLSWRREPEHREFHLGPLFSVNERAGGKRVALGNGIVAWQRDAPGGRWRLFWFDFPSKANKLRAASR